MKKDCKSLLYKGEVFFASKVESWGGCAVQNRHVLKYKRLKEEGVLSSLFAETVRLASLQQ